MTTDITRKASWVVAVGADHKLYARYNNDGVIPNSAVTYTSLGGSVRYEPYPLHYWSSWLIIFAIDATTGNLKAKCTSLASPNLDEVAWYNLGGICAGSPVAVYYEVDKKLAAFVIGMDGCMYQCSTEKSSAKWNWIKLATDSHIPAFFPDKICASTDQNGRIDLFAVGVDNQLYHRYWNGTVYSKWTGIGKNTVGSRPTSVTMNGNRVDVVVRDAADQKLWHCTIESGVYYNWQKVADELTIFNPSIDKWSDDRIEAAYINAKGETMHTWCAGIAPGTVGKWQNNKNPMDNFGGCTKGSPKIICRANNEADVFVTGMDSAIYLKSYAPGSAWSGWKRLGGVLVTKPC